MAFGYRFVYVIRGEITIPANSEEEARKIFDGLHQDIINDNLFSIPEIEVLGVPDFCVLHRKGFEHFEDANDLDPKKYGCKACYANSLMEL